MSETRHDPFRGNFVGGHFVPAIGDGFASHDPATSAGDVVTEAVADVGAVDAAVEAAQAALRGWRGAAVEARIDALRRVQSKVPAHQERIAQAITAEMGKSLAEARAEAGSIAGKIAGVIEQLPHELPRAGPGAPGEQRFHPLGVVAIIGPFNFPVHLLNTHVIPTLITGNTVVAKPSELTPLSGQRYAELFADADFPAGVFNLVHGLGATGAALAAHPGVRGVVFTGSYATGRRIREATFDRPGKKLSLELGGKNPALVLDDADLDQAVREILLGALLTTGQRCTATSRVIATPGIAPALERRLAAAFARVTPSPPTDPACFMGPLASHAARESFMARVAAGEGEGLKAIVPARALPGGAYVTPGLYRAQGGEATLSEELFGPHVAFEAAADEDDAFARAASNPFGLSASLFSARADALERFYDEVPAGVINFNRSTNGASGLLPFGGVGMSGNWHPAGSLAPRNATYPVAVMRAPLGERTPHAGLDRLLGDRPLGEIA